MRCRRDKLRQLLLHMEFHYRMPQNCEIPHENTHKSTSPATRHVQQSITSTSVWGDTPLWDLRNSQAAGKSTQTRGNVQRVRLNGLRRGSQSTRILHAVRNEAVNPRSRVQPWKATHWRLLPPARSQGGRSPRSSVFRGRSLRNKDVNSKRVKWEHCCERQGSIDQ